MQSRSFRTAFLPACGAWHVRALPSGHQQLAAPGSTTSRARRQHLHHCCTPAQAWGSAPCRAHRTPPGTRLRDRRGDSEAALEPQPRRSWTRTASTVHGFRRSCGQQSARPHGRTACDERAAPGPTLLLAFCRWQADLTHGGHAGEQRRSSGRSRPLELRRRRTNQVRGASASDQGAHSHGVQLQLPGKLPCCPTLGKSLCSKESGSLHNHPRWHDFLHQVSCQSPTSSSL